MDIGIEGMAIQLYPKTNRRNLLCNSINFTTLVNRRIQIAIISPSVKTTLINTGVILFDVVRGPSSLHSGNLNIQLDAR